MGNRLNSSSKLAPHVRWARVPAAWLWSRRLTEPPRPCSAREPGGSKWAVWEASCGMQGHFRTFSFILTWQSQKSTHFITQKEKVGAFFFPVHGIRRSPLYMHALYKCIRPPCTSAYFLFIYAYHIHRPKTPPWTRAICRKPHPTCRRSQASITAPAKRQPLFGRGGLGERRFSLRSGLSPSVPLCITLLNLLFSQSCPHVEKTGDFGFSTGWYSQAVERVKSGAKLENLGKKWGKSTEIFEKGKWKKEGIKRHGREYR